MRLQSLDKRVPTDCLLSAKVFGGGSSHQNCWRRRRQAPLHLPEHSAHKTIPTPHDKQHQALDCAHKKTTRCLKRVPLRHCEELHTDKLLGQGPEDRLVQQAGPTGGTC